MNTNARKSALHKRASHYNVMPTNCDWRDDATKCYRTSRTGEDTERPLISFGGICYRTTQPSGAPNAPPKKTQRRDDHPQHLNASLRTPSPSATCPFDVDFTLLMFWQIHSAAHAHSVGNNVPLTPPPIEPQTTWDWKLNRFQKSTSAFLQDKPRR